MQNLRPLFSELVKGKANGPTQILFDLLPMGMAIFDSKGLLVATNKADIEMFGIKSKAGTMGVNLFYDIAVAPELQEVIATNDEDEIRINHLFDFDKIKETGRYSKSGKMRLFSYLKKFRDEHGEIEGYMLINMEDKRSDEELKGLYGTQDQHGGTDPVFQEFFEKSPIAAVITDANKRIIRCNESFLRLFQIKNREYAVGFPMPQQPKKPTGESVVDPNADYWMYENEYDFTSNVYPFIGVDYLYLRVEGIRLYDSDGILKGHFFYMTDLTKKKQYEDGLKRQRERALEKSEMKSRFLQNMSHDIRNPLNAIVGFSQLLGLPDGTLTEEEKEEYSNHIANNSNMLIMLVDDILNISDVENGNYKVTLRPVNINELCANTLKSVEYRVPGNVKLYYTTDVDNDASFTTDGRRVQQILINYLTNACKHITEGEIKLVCNTKENPKQIHFSVIDTGEGIDPSMADDLFQRFMKLNTVQGTGLGLNICYTISQKLGGTVSYDKSYTGGAKFDLYLPVKPITA